MSVKLDWQVDKDVDELEWDAPDTAAQPDVPSVPAREGVERHPELVRLQLSGGITTRERAGRLYLLCGAAVLVVFVAMYIFI